MAGIFRPRFTPPPRSRWIPTAAAGAGTVNQAHFRIRSDDTQTLNTDAGWAAALDTNATIDAEKVFRVRFEIEETAGGAFSSALKLQYRKNGGTWTDVADRAVAENVQTATNPMEGVLSGQYADGDATTNILSGSGQSFTAGTGEEGPATGTKNLQSQHMELEWALRMRQMFHDGTNKGRAADGDTFELRIVESGGTVLSGTYTIPTITLNSPDGLIAATSIETPKRMGPFMDTNGNLYYYVEYSEPNASDDPAMLKSTDGGKQWAIVDQANAPDAADGADDNESVDIQQVGSVLHIGGFHSSDRVRYHTFQMSDDGSPDTWGVVSQVVADPTSPFDQDVSIGVRSDGSVICAYQTAGDTVGYKIRSTGGTWGSETILDSTASIVFSSAIIVIGASDLAYFIYKDHTNNILYYKTLTTGGTLSGRTQFNATGTVPQIKAIPTAYYFDDGGTETIVAFFRRGSNMIERRIIGGSLQTERTISDAAIAINQNGSGAPEAALAVWGDDIHAAWIDSTDTSLVQYDTSQDGAAYSTDVNKYDSAITGLSMQGAQVYRHSGGNGGALVMAVVVDEGDGFTGGQRYLEWTVAETGGGNVTVQVTAGSATWTGQTVNISITVPVTAGSVAWTGQTVTPTRVTPVTAGSATWTGQTVTTRITAPVTAGSVVWTGQTVNTAVATVVPVTAGSVVWNGQTATANLRVPVTAGSVVWQGQTVNVAIAVVVPVTSGAVAWNGQTATTRLTVPVTAGSVTWVGQTVNVSGAAVVQVTPGAVTWTGQNVALRFTHAITAGSVTWNGQTVSIVRTTPVVTGFVTWQGQTVNVIVPLIVPVTPGAVVWQGQIVTVVIPGQGTPVKEATWATAISTENEVEPQTRGILVTAGTSRNSASEIP